MQQTRTIYKNSPVFQTLARSVLKRRHFLVCLTFRIIETLPIPHNGALRFPLRPFKYRRPIRIREPVTCRRIRLRVNDKNVYCGKMSPFTATKRHRMLSVSSLFQRSVYALIVLSPAPRVSPVLPAVCTRLAGVTDYWTGQ